MSGDNLVLKDANQQPFTLRTRDLTGTGVHAYFTMVVTAIPTPVGANQTITLATGSDSTFTVPAGATHAQGTVDQGGGDLRYWENGSSPSATTGWDVPAGSGVEFTNLANVKMRSTTGSVPLQSGYRRYDL